MGLVGTLGCFGRVEVNVDRLEGVFKAYPERDELPTEINENLIVELYSK